ncbi:DUF192 domain-containing protein [Candidatus Marsarchaeota archaeon]|nr:DUF192 domain-containing protein [Candidatus Marsarchaeota archaeon]
MFSLLRFIYLRQKYDSIRIEIGHLRMNAIVADTFAKSMIGLMFRKSLGQNKCMLFTFKKPGRHSIWMKNMRFAIDVMWLGEDRKIIEIIENILPCEGFRCEAYGKSRDSMYFIEANSGFVKKNRIKKGMPVRIGM